jgi:hypothetical protein
MKRQASMLFVAGITALTGTTQAAGPETPIRASPGSRTAVAMVEARCPTFSWGSVAGAEAYELVVYELGNPDEETQAVLRETFHGTVSAWTPSLERCLKRGARYAWSARTEGTEPGQWSEPSLFQVAAVSREMELEEALRVVKAHLGDRSVEPQATSEQPTFEQKIHPSRGSRPPSNHAVSSVPKSGTVSPTLLSVSGNVNAESFSGDGSELTNLNEGDPLYSDSPAAMSVETTTVPDDATPSVEGTTVLVVSGYTVATDIVDLDDGLDGQCVAVVGGLSTVNPALKSHGQGGNFRLFRDTDSQVLEHNTLTVCRSSGTWFEISRQTNRP